MPNIKPVRVGLPHRNSNEQNRAQTQQNQANFGQNQPQRASRQAQQAQNQPQRRMMEHQQRQQPQTRQNQPQQLQHHAQQQSLRHQIPQRMPAQQAQASQNGQYYAQQQPQMGQNQQYAAQMGQNMAMQASQAYQQPSQQAYQPQQPQMFQNAQNQQFGYPVQQQVQIGQYGQNMQQMRQPQQYAAQMPQNTGMQASQQGQQQSKKHYYKPQVDKNGEEIVNPGDTPITHVEPELIEHDSFVDNLLDGVKMSESTKKRIKDVASKGLLGKITSSLNNSGKKEAKKSVPLPILVGIVALVLVGLFVVPTVVSVVQNSSKPAQEQHFRGDVPATSAKDLIPVPRNLTGHDAWEVEGQVSRAGFNVILKDSEDNYIHKSDFKDNERFRVKSVFPDTSAAKGSQVVVTVIPGSADASSVIKTGDTLDTVVKALKEKAHFPQKYLKIVNTDELTINLDHPDKSDYVLTNISADDNPVFTFDSKQLTDEKSKHQNELNDLVQKARKAKEDGGISSEKYQYCDKTLIGQKGVEKDGTVWVCKAPSDPTDKPRWTKE